MLGFIIKEKLRSVKVFRQNATIMQFKANKNSHLLQKIGLKFEKKLDKPQRVC